MIYALRSPAGSPLRSRHTVLAILTLWLVLFAVRVRADEVGKVENATQPNVLFFVVDDLNDWNSLFDSESPIKCPNLERLAARGTLFTRAYWMSPACNPTRAAFIGLPNYENTSSGSLDKLKSLGVGLKSYYDHDHGFNLGFNLQGNLVF